MLRTPTSKRWLTEHIVESRRILLMPWIAVGDIQTWGLSDPMICHGGGACALKCKAAGYGIGPEMYSLAIRAIAGQ